MRATAWLDYPGNAEDAGCLRRSVIRGLFHDRHQLLQVALLQSLRKWSLLFGKIALTQSRPELYSSAH